MPYPRAAKFGSLCRWPPAVSDLSAEEAILFDLTSADQGSENIRKRRESCVISGPATAAVDGAAGEPASDVTSCVESNRVGCVRNDRTARDDKNELSATSGQGSRLREVDERDADGRRRESHKDVGGVDDGKDSNRH